MSASGGLSEAAKRTGLSPHQVRNYLHFRLIHASARSARGHYQFDQAAVDRLRLIGLAAHAGLRHESLRRFLDALDERDIAVLRVERVVVARFIDERRSNLRQLGWELNRAYKSPEAYGAFRSQRIEAHQHHE